MALGLLAPAAVVAVLVPPLGEWARRSDWAESLQFSILFMIAPGVFVASAPWARLGLSRWAGSLAASRRRHPERLRSAGTAVVALAVAVAWRTPAAVDLLAKGTWPLLVEVPSLSVTGVALWLECVASPPLAPRGSRPVSIAVCAASVWTVWVCAYLVAMSAGAFYPAFRHSIGHGIGLDADQQITAGLLWAAAAGCFVPVIFYHLVEWLRSEEDPDQELHRLVREERRRTAPTR